VTKLQVIGGGKMGEALFGGLLAAGWASAGELRVVEKLAARRQELTGRYPGVEIAPDIAAVGDSLVAVKPGDVEEACAALGRTGAARRVLSIAAGVTIAHLEASLGSRTVAVVRAMPNTPALVGLGASAIAPGTAAGDDDLAWAESLLGAVGIVVRVKEGLLDAVTGLSGSGPAYVFLIAEALIEAGVLVGLPRPTAQALAVQTLLGSSQLLAADGRPASELRADVTSPGGTTAAGLRVLEQRAVRAALIDAVAAATERATELGRG
jgi:pyrroline-5-carboxylate reductase